jgi:hypothetical protein
MPHALRNLLTVAAFLVASAATVVDAQGRRIEELTRKSGLWDQVTQMRAQMKHGVSEARRQAKAGGKDLLDDAAFAKLMASIDRTFSPETLRESMTLFMEDYVTPADEVEVLKWLSSDLGAIFTRMEVAAGTLEEIKKAEVEAPKIRAALTRARLEKYQRLAGALDPGNSTTTLTINLTSAIVYGVSLVTPDTDANAAATAIRRNMELQRPEMVKYFAERALLTYSYVYRNATDAQVETYVRFAESAAARRYHAAGIKALDETITQAALAMGQDLGVALQERRNQS